MKSLQEYLKESCDCWKGHKRVPGTKPCAPGSCVKEETVTEGERGLWDNIHAKQKRIKAGSGEKMRKPGSKGAPTAAALKASQNEEVELDEAVDPSEISSNPKMYNSEIVKKAYYHKNASASDKESLAKHLDRYHGNKEWRKPVKEESELDEATPYYNKPSFLKKMGRVAKQERLAREKKQKESKPVKEELSLDEQFDVIEEMIMALAEQYNMDPETVWEKFEVVDDVTLYEAAVDAKGHKSSTGGLTQKGRDAYNAKGANLQAPVTTPPSKLKAGSKAANRRKSFCARMGGMEGAMKKPNGEPTRKALALRKWNC